MQTLDIVDAASLRSDIPAFGPGDTVKVGTGFLVDFENHACVATTHGLIPSALAAASDSDRARNSWSDFRKYQAFFL